MYEHVSLSTFKDRKDDKKLEKFLQANIVELQRIRKNLDFPLNLIKGACSYIDNAISLLLEASESSEWFQDFVYLVEKNKAKYKKRIEAEFDVLEESMYYENGKVVIVREDALKAIERIRNILKEN